MMERGTGYDGGEGTGVDGIGEPEMMESGNENDGAGNRK